LREDPEYKLTPIIFITAKAQLNELMDYSRLGVLGIIRKPFDPLSISTSIYDLWKNFHENPSSGRM